MTPTKDTTKERPKKRSPTRKWRRSPSPRSRAKCVSTAGSASTFPNVGYSYLQKLLRSGQVRVDSKRAQANDRLERRPGDPRSRDHSPAKGVQARPQSAARCLERRPRHHREHDPVRGRRRARAQQAGRHRRPGRHRHQAPHRRHARRHGRSLRRRPSAPRPPPRPRYLRRPPRRQERARSPPSSAAPSRPAQPRRPIGRS